MSGLSKSQIANREIEIIKIPFFEEIAMTPNDS